MKYLLFIPLFLVSVCGFAQNNPNPAYYKFATLSEALSRKMQDYASVDIAQGAGGSFVVRKKSDGFTPDFGTVLQMVSDTSRVLVRDVSQTRGLQLEWFRINLTDADTLVWRRATNAMNAVRKPLYVSTQNYSFASTFTFSGDYWYVVGTANQHGDGTKVSKTGSTYRYINSTNLGINDTTFPTETNPACMNGSVFYFVSSIQDFHMENINMNAGRFGASFLIPSNSAVFKGCNFANDNIGVFCYQGSQNYQLTNCSVSGSTGSLFVAGASCFSAASPYTNQANYYCDGLEIKNTDGYAAIGGQYNEYFNDWFVASILRPSVLSYNNVTAETYPYADSSIYCRPSGWAIFIPMRNNRVVYGLTLEHLDVRYGAPRGTLFVGSSVSGLNVNGYATEGQFVATPPPGPTTPLFTVGRGSGGTFINVLGDSYTHPIVNMITRGASGSSTDFSNFYFFNSTGTYYPNQNISGFHNGTVYYKKRVRSSVVLDQSTGGSSTAGAALLRGIRPRENADVLSYDEDSSIIEKGAYKMIDLPFFAKGEYKTTARITSTASQYNQAGLMRVDVWNASRGDGDHALYYIQNLSNADSETIAISAPINNGDQYISLPSAPNSTQRFAVWQITSSNKVQVDHWDGDSLRLWLLEPVTNLSSPVATGAAIKAVKKITVIEDFQKDYVDIGFGIANSSSSYELGISSKVSTTSTTLNGEPLRILITASSIVGDMSSGYTAGIPTTGRWKKGARLKEINPVSGGFSSYVCTVSGEPGTWYGVGLVGGSTGGAGSNNPDSLNNQPGSYYASVASLSAYTPTSRNINTTAPLTGGGNLTADRTLSITQATTSTNGYVSATDWNTFNNKYSSSGGNLNSGSFVGMPKLAARPATPSSSYTNFYFDSTGRLSYVNSSGYNRTFRLPYAGDVLVTYPTLATPILEDSNHAVATYQGKITGTGIPYVTAGAFSFTTPVNTAIPFGITGTGVGFNNNFNYDNTNTRVGIGLTTPLATLHAVSTTAQMRLGYDATTNYSDFKSNVDGSLTITPSNGNMTLSAGVTIAGGLSTNQNPDNANFSVGAGTGVSGATTTPELLPAGVSSMQKRVYTRGSNSGTSINGVGYSSVIIGRQLETVPNAVTVPLGASLLIKPPVFTITGTGAVTNAYSLIIDSMAIVASGTMPGGAMWVRQGRSRFSDTVQITDGTQGAGKVFTSDANGMGKWGSASTLLSTTSISGTATSIITLFIVPTGKTLVVTNCIVRVVSASGVTTGASASVTASAAGTIYANASMSGLTATPQLYKFPNPGISVYMAGGDIVRFNINTAATGSSPTQTLNVDLFGYLL